jgi:hypothetical protein
MGSWLRPCHAQKGICAFGDGDERESCLVENRPIFLKQGVVRMATQTNAILIPISVRRIGLCRFEIHYHSPVPDDLIRKHEAGKANQYLVSDLWADIKDDPTDLNWTTLEELSPALNKKRIG